MNFKRDYVYDISYVFPNPQNTSEFWRSISVCMSVEKYSINFQDLYVIIKDSDDGIFWSHSILTLNSKKFEIKELGHIKDFPEYEL